MIEISNYSQETRQFDIALAKLGAPIITTRGSPVRIICWDKVGDCYKQELVGLVKRYSDNDVEDVCTFLSTGLSTGSRSAGDLMMAPVATVEGKAVFTGDEVFGLLGKSVTIDFRDHGYAQGGEIPGLKLKPPPIRFEGNWINIDSMIWYRATENSSWRYVKCGDNWNENPGAIESHFGYLKRNEGRTMCLHYYTSKCPHSLVIDGEEVKVGDKLWAKVTRNEIVVWEAVLQGFKEGRISVENYTRKAPVKVENWQAKVYLLEEPKESAIFVGQSFPSKDECDTWWKKNAASICVYVGSEKVSEYYV